MGRSLAVMGRLTLAALMLLMAGCAGTPQYSMAGADGCSVIDTNPLSTLTSGQPDFTSRSIADMYDLNADPPEFGQSCVAKFEGEGGETTLNISVSARGETDATKAFEAFRQADQAKISADPFPGSLVDIEDLGDVAFAYSKFSAPFSPTGVSIFQVVMRHGGLFVSIEIHGHANPGACCWPKTEQAMVDLVVNQVKSVMTRLTP